MVEAHARASRLIQAHGAEVLGYLCALLKSDQAADEAYAAFCEDVLHGADGIREPERERAWVFTVARHAALKLLRGERRGAVPLEVRSDDGRLAARQSLPAFRPTVERTVSQLRAELSPDDQTLLVLRVERGLSWQEVAEVLHGGPLEDEDRTRAAASLRKRFERLKNELKARAEALGLDET